MRTFILLVMLSVLTAAGRAEAEEDRRSIHLRGSGSIAPMAQMVAEGYMAENPGVSVVVQGGGSDRGYAALIDGTADVAMTSSPMTAEDEKRARKTRVKLVSMIFGRDALVAIVNPANPVKGLKGEEVTDLFSGHTSMWPGTTTPVSVVFPPADNNITEIWRDKSVEGEIPVSPKAVYLPDPADVVARVAKDPGAIGVVNIGKVDATVKALSLYGITANNESIAKKTYPVLRDEMLWTREDASAEVIGFVKYFTNPNKGMKFIDTIKAVPAE
jgi:phosphate transport system substrate-binding protein